MKKYFLYTTCIVLALTGLNHQPYNRSRVTCCKRVKCEDPGIITLSSGKFSHDCKKIIVGGFELSVCHNMEVSILFIFKNN